MPGFLLLGRFEKEGGACAAWLGGALFVSRGRRGASGAGRNDAQVEDKMGVLLTIFINTMRAH